MVISDKNKDFLIKNVKNANKYIESDDVGDLLAILEDLIIEDEIKNDGLSKFGLKLEKIYDEIDEAN